MRAAATTPTIRRCMRRRSSGNAEIITMLLAAGGDPELPTGSLAARRCIIAATYGRLDAVRLLAAAGADLNARDYQGRTPLWIAASRGHAAVVEALLAAGADHDARDDKDMSPFLAAIGEERGGRTALGRAHARYRSRLRGRGLERPCRSGAAARRARRRCECARSAWTSGALPAPRSIPARRCWTGSSPAASTSTVTALPRCTRRRPRAARTLSRLLLDLNVPVDVARRRRGDGAAVVARAPAQSDVVRLLLARGAERYPRDREGRGIEAYMAMAVGPHLGADRAARKARAPTGRPDI